jgi:hypothetical protein
MIGRRTARGGTALLAAVCVASLARSASADEPKKLVDDEAGEAPEHTILVGVGGAAEVELGDGTLHPGANLMVEWDAIEDWLEFEVGASVLATNGGVEVPVDLLLKKPFKLARWAEFMIGVGPELVQVTGTNKGTHFGGEVALDFMFWPWGRHVGLWVEPEYDLIFHDGASSGIGGTGGVLVGW